MPGLSYLKKDGKELQTYFHNPELGIFEFPFVFDTVVEGEPVPGPGDRTQATLINCSALSAGRTKTIRLVAYDLTNSNVMLNLWFAETKEEIEQAVATGNPAQLPMIQGFIDINLPVSSSWIAVDYDNALAGAISPSSFNMLLLIA